MIASLLRHAASFAALRGNFLQRCRAIWRAWSSAIFALETRALVISLDVSAGIFTSWVLERMVGSISDSFSATSINKVSGGGSSMSFNNLFPSLPRYSGIHISNILNSLSKLLRVSLRMMSLHSWAVIFPCLFSAPINCSQSYALP